MSSLDTPIFYLEGQLEGEVSLSGDEFRHAVRSLRKQAGDTLLLTNGNGVLHEAVILRVGRDDALLECRKSEIHPKRSFQITIAVAPTKNTKRIEWAFEKMAEIGVDRLIPVICARSERKEFKTDRLKKIAIAAMKQSQQVWLPEIVEPVNFPGFIESFVGRTDVTRLIAHKSGPSKPLSHNYTKGGDVVLVIGPEGDFTREELAMADSNGFSRTLLGETRLRTETAALMSVAYIHVLNQL